MNSDNENKNRQIAPLKTSAQISRNAAEKSHSFIWHTPIISYTGKKRRRRFSFRKLIIPFFCLLVSFFILACYAENAIRPKIYELCAISAKKMVTETIYETVGNMAKSGVLSYDDMVHCNRDAEGTVNFLEVDTALLSSARTQIVKQIDDALEKRKNVKVNVPLGSLSGWNLFGGMGFPVRVAVYPIGSTESDIYTVLEDCGINQTRHLIRIDVKIVLVCVLPKENCTVEAEVSVPLGERVLVGDVPEIYLDSIGTG